ncbi:MAG: nitronate monooxygenase [Desulfobacteraceae bacterium]|nr:MAG: nitronate monooxygenase [Desulfobacteraceae bacterium]
MARIHTGICDLLKIDFPILLAGMGSPLAEREFNASGPKLVAAVCEAGGMGFIGGAPLYAEELREQIREVKRLTNRPFGVDLLMPMNIPPTMEGAAKALGVPKETVQKAQQFVESLMKTLDVPEPTGRPRPFPAEDLVRSQLDVVFEEGVSALATGLGVNPSIVSGLHERHMRLFCLVGNVKTALRVADIGADVIVATGYESGGHTGRVGTMALIPQVVDAVSPIPVIAGGGIGDGRGLAAALSLGAQGVWCGSRFLATHEALIPDFVKKNILDASEEDTLIQKVFTGKTARTIKCRVVEMWQESGIPTLPMPLQGMVMNRLLRGLIQSNKHEYVAGFAGQVIGMVKEIEGARDLFDRMVQQAVHLLRDELPALVVS